MGALTPFIIFMTGLLIIIITLLIAKYWPVNKKSLKVNKHGLSYKTRLYGRSSFNLAFYDDKTKKLIWLLYVGIDHNNYSWDISEYRPKTDYNFYSLYEIQSQIDRISSIEEVIKHNDSVKLRTEKAQIEFDKQLKDKLDRVNKYL